MRIIVISHPELLKEEGALVNALFDEGLELFHLRKPNASYRQLESFIASIRPVYQHRIAWHQHHELAMSMGSKRLHFNERDREKHKDNYFLKLKSDEFILSTSLHDITYISEIKFFNYIFYGPVFNSISKPDYLSKYHYDTSYRDLFKEKNLVALGGLNNENYKETFNQGFSGAAFLGYIWGDPDEAILQYKKLKR